MRVKPNSFQSSWFHHFESTVQGTVFALLNSAVAGIWFQIENRLFTWEERMLKKPGCAVLMRETSLGGDEYVFFHLASDLFFFSWTDVPVLENNTSENKHYFTKKWMAAHVSKGGSMCHLIVGVNRQVTKLWKSSTNKCFSCNATVLLAVCENPIFYLVIHTVYLRNTFENCYQYLCHIDHL